MNVKGVCKLLQVLVLAAAAIGTPSAALAIFESEPNQDTGSATAFNTAGDTLDGNFTTTFGGPFGRDDYWGPIALNAGQGVTVNAGFTNCSIALDPTDIGIDIINSAGANQASEDSGGACQNENLSFTATVSGDYYIILFEATNSSNGITQYSVSVTPTGPTPTPTPTPAPTATPTPTPTPIPTVTEWGLIFMGLMLLMAGVIVLRRRSPASL